MYVRDWGDSFAMSSTEATQQCLAGGGVGLEGPRWLYSNVCCLGKLAGILIPDGESQSNHLHVFSPAC